MTSPQFNGIAQCLVEDGLLSHDAMERALQIVSKQQSNLIPYLVSHGLAPSNRIANSIAKNFGDPLFDIRQLDLTDIPKDLVDEKIIRKYSALPIFVRDKRIFVAMSDPTNLNAIDAIQFNSRLSVQTVVVEENKLLQVIEDVYGNSMSSFSELADDDLPLNYADRFDDDNSDSNLSDDATTFNSEVDEAPVVKFVNKMLIDAIRMGASDLHFEPYEKSYRVRFRIDGMMQKIASPPLHLAVKIAARLKVMSQMDISERRLPQDGRIKLKLSEERIIDFRVNSLPTLFGEKIVLRLLDPTSAQLGIDALGYEDDQKQLFLGALKRPQGMILITGPTGSGKTVSLYTGLSILNKVETNISTAEDPVEIHLEGINQVNINPKIGLTFANALRSFLRQDPDVVMVGEIRDLETAEIAIKAAQTGHLVLSTLHTNSAPQTLTRLHNMGIPTFNIASSISLVIAQRLARKLCNFCKRPVNLPTPSLLELGFSNAQLTAPGTRIHEPVGCSECRDGYSGRVGIYEVMNISDRISRLIMAGGNAIDLKEAAVAEGLIDLRQAAILKVLRGVTSVQEMQRVTSD